MWLILNKVVDYFNQAFFKETNANIDLTKYFQLIKYQLCL